MHALMADPPKKPTQRRASAIAYAMGWRACEDGVLIDENPFPDGRTHKSERRQWFDGFIRHRTLKRLGHILEKYPE